MGRELPTTRKKLFIEIVTYPVNDPDSRKRKIVDWYCNSDRKWLANHVHWALNNAHVVSSIPQV